MGVQKGQQLAKIKLELPVYRFKIILDNQWKSDAGKTVCYLSLSITTTGVCRGNAATPSQCLDQFKRQMDNCSNGKSG